MKLNAKSMLQNLEELDNCVRILKQHQKVPKEKL